MAPLILNIVEIVLVIVFAFIIISKIFPNIRILLDGLIKDNKSLAGFMSLLIIIVYILTFSKIVNLLLEITENQYITYLNLITPGIDILNAILPYIQYILLGALIAWGLQSAKK